MIFFLFLLFFIPFFASSQELNPKGLSFPNLEKDSPLEENKKQPAVLNRISISEGELSKADKTKHSISVHLESEGRLSKNPISINQKEVYPSIPYSELEFRYSKNKNLSFFVNLEAESYENEWKVSLDELYFSYIFETVPLSVKAGWFILPLGYIGQNSNLFSHDLSLYGVLTQNQEDMGFVTDVYIWKEFLSLQGSIFGGWSYRESDDSYKAPDSIPLIVSLKSHGFFWDAFVSYFQKDLAFFDPLQAWGAGVELKADYKEINISVQSEFWQVLEKGQTAFAYYVFPKLSVRKFQAGMVFGDINRFSPDSKTAQVKSSVYEGVFQLTYQVHPNVIFIGERFISKQRRGLLVNDAWAVRIKLHFDWSKDF